MQKSAVTIILTLVIGQMGCNPLHTRVAPNRALEAYETPVFTIPNRENPTSQQATGWSFFNDPELEDALKQVWKDNLTIAQSLSRLKAAKAAKDVANASWFPTVDLNGTRSKSESFMFGRTFAQDQWTASVAASYEVDLFDRLGGTRRAAALEHEATRHDARAVRITVSATYADAWFQHREAVKAIDLYREQRNTSEAFFSLTRARFSNGLATATDVLQQRQQLEALLTMAAPLEARVALTAHQLRVLEGKVPTSDGSLQGVTLPAAPEIAQLKLDVSRLMTRPDLVAARLRVAAVDEQVGAALANRLPSLRLSGNIGVGAESFSDLLDQWFFGITTSLIAPLFDGGRRSAEVERQRALLELALNQYRALYLTAIREVKDALILAHQEDIRLAALTQELQTAEQLLTETKRRYMNGVGSYLAVLNALQTFQRKERERLTTRRNQLTHRISLWRALGGVYTLPSQQVALPERFKNTDA
ncbi:MAG: efflux transporter outer membrane subunit [Bradymonadia bacterium]